jgi:hypothetical protein
VKDRRQHRLDLLCRLREMNVEQARAEHVAAQAELDQRRERADDTQRRLEALDEWTVAQISRGSPLAPELLRQAHLFRGAEKSALDEQRAEEARQGEVTEAARGELSARFEELSVAERLSARHVQLTTHEESRRGFVELDEAGIRKHYEAKE